MLVTAKGSKIKVSIKSANSVFVNLLNDYLKSQAKSYMLKWRLKKYTHDASLRKKCPYLEFFWSVFSRIRTDTERYSVLIFSGGSKGNIGKKRIKHTLKIYKKLLSWITFNKEAFKFHRQKFFIWNLTIWQIIVYCNLKETAL